MNRIFLTVFIYVLLLFAALISVSAAEASVLKTSFLPIRDGAVNVRVGVQNPDGKVIGDILYLTGFADRLDNHEPLFKTWNGAGFRVISFDFPSQGETYGVGNTLNAFDFTAIIHLVMNIEKSTREDQNRPLILAGWSTGGLVVARMSQRGMLKTWDRPVKGLILIAPGVSVYTFVGEAGFVTQKTLTDNPAPPHEGAIYPISPFFEPVFAGELQLNALLSRHEVLDAQVPVLTLVADDKKDDYAKSPNLKKWVQDQRLRDSQLEAAQCVGSRHEMDNEPEPTGAEVRKLSALFASQVVKASASPHLNSLGHLLESQLGSEENLWRSAQDVGNNVSGTRRHCALF